jgi:hypothetical protein
LYLLLSRRPSYALNIGPVLLRKYEIFNTLAKKGKAGPGTGADHRYYDLNIPERSSPRGRAPLQDK